MHAGRAVSVVLIGMLVLLVGVGCRKPLSVPLVFRPTDTNRVISGPAMDGTVRVTVIDARDNKEDIGVNIERSDPVRVFTIDVPTEFVRQVLVERLRDYGAEIVTDSSAKPRRVLEMKLTRFWSTESDTYKTEVIAIVTVTDAAAGKEMWKGVVSGGNSRFGLSLSEENYQESFSDSTLQMITSLLSNAEFRDAMK